MKTLKHTHRSGKKANQIPASATFNAKKSPIPEHHTNGSMSKRKR